ncbi:amino acid deaminase [Pseudoalteromonas byunsanensis]|uniref:Amino acid deaminase n=1 Tax=Pseudoalteromonas byunsanensis TaxID=327939 RepID=A0A1S1N9L5_9GAMM|nr:amino acid deaminase [Pseudoalteromonas byunsanensis]OHU96053.1 amino acid deaminase [Pseudoalteromonas byunsanensis]
MSEFLKGSGKPELLATQGWNILAEEVSFPVAVVKQSAISNNARWMAQYALQAGVKLAPHGKTTMSPDLFKQQIEQGAWAISLATVPQVLNAVEQGIDRIILANQLVGKHHFELIAQLLIQTDTEFYCFVDSPDNARQLGEFFQKKNVSLNILLEVGVENGRCGVRSNEQVFELLGVCQQFTALNVCGLSFYEGVIATKHAVEQINAFVNDIMAMAVQIQQHHGFAVDRPIITGAGSAWYDVVAKAMNTSKTCERFTYVLRPGCYLIHDTGIYQTAQQQVEKRCQLACDITGSLTSGLYLWAYVVSRAQPNQVIIGLGKRDVAFDAGLPTPELTFAPQSQKLDKAPCTFRVTHIMDQHCMMSVASDSTLKVGDLVCFSSSHPCLTFDKWRQIGVVEDEWVINKTLTTYF